MQRLTSLIAGAALAATLPSIALAQTTLTLNSWLPPSHPMIAEFIQPMMDDIANVTEGRVTVTMLPAPLGPPPATYDLVKNGVVDIGYTVQGYSPGRFKTSGLAEMPFLGNDAEVISVAFQRVHDAMLADAGEYEGVKVMAVFTHGPGQIFSSSALNTVDDIEGLKFRTGSVVAHDLAELMGAVPVEGPASKSYELLSQKVADGIFFPWESIEFFRLGDLLTDVFVADGGVYNTAFLVAMNEAKWNSISEEDRALIEPLLGEALAARAGAMWNAADAAGYQNLSQNLAVHEASADEIDLLKSRFASVVEVNVATASEAGIDSQAPYEMLLAEIEKLSAE